MLIACVSWREMSEKRKETSNKIVLTMKRFPTHTSQIRKGLNGREKNRWKGWPVRVCVCGIAETKRIVLQSISNE